MDCAMASQVEASMSPSPRIFSELIVCKQDLADDAAKRALKVIAPQFCQFQAVALLYGTVGENANASIATTMLNIQAWKKRLFL